MDIEVQITKRLGDFTLEIDFQGHSKRIGILGASGCGKSMTLKSIAGIETPDAGRIRIGDKVLFDSHKKINITPQKRRVGYLFQNYALFPTMTVEQNIAAGLSGTKAAKAERVREMVEKFRLSGLEKRLPGELSGGQQQRVALARIMAYEPEVILLDEPYAALDMFLRDRLQKKMAEMLADYPGIVIMVSHSRDELYRFSEELLLIEEGEAVVYGRTKGIFKHPVYCEAARLTGCKNIARISRLDAHTAEVEEWGILLHTKTEIPEDVDYIGYRAHDFVPVWGERRENCLKVQVESMAELPFERNYYLLPENKSADRKQVISWFVQREGLGILKEKGLPDYLELAEERLLFLKRKKTDVKKSI